MADDVLGHEHLDHGKHLHKGPNAHSHGAHAQKKKRNYSHVGVLQAKGAQHEKHKNETGEHEKQNIHAQRRSQNWKLYVGAAVGALLLILFFAFSIPALAVLGGVLLVNAVLELHKLFTGSLPVDIEILYSGVAYLSASYSVIWGLLLAVVGPTVAALARSHFCEEEFIKSATLAVTAIAAMLLGATSAGMFFAVLFGIIAQYAAISGLGLQPGFNNALSRLTAAGVNAYVLLLLLPSVLRG